MSVLSRRRVSCSTDKTPCQHARRTPHRSPQPLRRSLASTLALKSSELASQAQRTADAHLLAACGQKWDLILKTELLAHERAQLRMTEAALCIQKHVRSMLVRAVHEPPMVSKRQTITAAEVSALTEQSNWCTISLRSELKPAVQLIGAHYQRFQVKKKLAWMRQYYLMHMQSLAEQRIGQIKSLICKFHACLIVNALKLENYKKKRLPEIKRRLAVLRIKNFWRKRKLSFRIIKDRLLRIKRKKAALALKEQQAKAKLMEKNRAAELARVTPAESLASPEPQTAFDPADYSDSSSDDSVLKLEMTEEAYAAYKKQRRAAKRLRAIKVAKAKVAYGLTDRSPAEFIPLMQELALKEEESESPSHVLSSTRSVIAKTSLCWQFTRPATRNTMIAEPRPVNSRGMKRPPLPPLVQLDPPEIALVERRRFSTKEVDNAHFLVQTTASAKRNVVSRASPKRRKNIIALPFTYENALKDTIATFAKQQPKVSTGKDSPWKPAYHRRNAYTPSLDNAWYMPKPWKRTAYTPVVHKDLQLQTGEPEKTESPTVSPSARIPSIDCSISLSVR